MKTVALVLCLALSGCATLWQRTYDCASAQSQKAQADLGQAVITILESGGYESALLGLARALGADGLSIINCVVSQYLASSKPRLSGDGAQHAQDWLRKHGAPR